MKSERKEYKYLLPQQYKNRRYSMFHNDKLVCYPNQIINLIMLSHTQRSCVQLNYLAAYGIRYSRQYFEELNIDHEAIRNEQLRKQAELKKQTLLRVKCNDKNPANYLKNVRVGNPALQNFARFQQAHRVQKCEILTPEPRKEKVFIHAIRKYILTSIKKATDAMAPVKRKYLYDAINQLQASHKKVARLMLPTFYNLVKHAVDQGKDPLRLYVHGCIIGKTRRFRGIRYHGRAKTGRQKTDICQIKVILYEMDEKQFFQKVGNGEAPSAFASLIRFGLVNNEANHEKLTQFVGITTAKGRQQKKQIIKRKVFMKMAENEKSGVFVPKKTIEKQIREQEGQKVKQLLKSLKKQGEMSSIQAREKVFKKNMGLQ